MRVFSFGGRLSLFTAPQGALSHPGVQINICICSRRWEHSSGLGAPGGHSGCSGAFQQGCTLALAAAEGERAAGHAPRIREHHTSASPDVHLPVSPAGLTMLGLVL